MEGHGLPKSVGAICIEMVVRYDSVTRNEIIVTNSLTKVRLRRGFWKSHAHEAANLAASRKMFD
jgi:hypothetical protein